MGKRVFLFGAFQDGSRPSTVCTDVSFGDLLIYKTMRNAIEAAGHKVDFILPDDEDRLVSLTPDDVLVIGGGGLIHPHMLNRRLIEICKARKAAYGIGINWSYGVHRGALHGMVDLWSFVRDIPFVVVRDWDTKAFLRMEKAIIAPDVAFLNWNDGFQPGNNRAVVIGPGLQQTDPQEYVLYMNKIWERENAEKITSISQFGRFAFVRCNAYHAMICTLMYGAVSNVKFTNVKQDAFVNTFAEKLAIDFTHDGALIRCKDPKWFYTEVESAMGKLLAYIDEVPDPVVPAAPEVVATPEAPPTPEAPAEA